MFVVVFTLIQILRPCKIILFISSRANDKPEYHELIPPPSSRKPGFPRMWSEWVPCPSVEGSNDWKLVVGVLSHIRQVKNRRQVKADRRINHFGESTLIGSMGSNSWINGFMTRATSAQKNQNTLSTHNSWYKMDGKAYVWRTLAVMIPWLVLKNPQTSRKLNKLFVCIYNELD